MSITSYVCGIDVGINGCFAILSKKGKSIKVEEFKLMPKLKGKVNQPEVVKILTGWQMKYPYLTIVIEKQGAVAKQGRTSGFTIGRRMGFLEGVAMALRVPVVIVSPQTWQKIFKQKYKNLNISKEVSNSKLKDTKKRSITWCKKIFPNVVLKTPRGRFLDELSDSILIGYWALQQEDIK